MKLKNTLGLASAALVSSAALSSAATYTEVGDAGQDFSPTGFQVTSGVGSLDNIVGELTGDVDHYLITITDPGLFFASTDARFGTGAGTASYDSLLALFLPDGTPVMLNDDGFPSGTPFHSFLADPATFTGLGGALTGTPASLVPGDYILGVAGFGNEPQDAGGADAFLPDGSFETLRGPAVAGPAVGWAGGATGTYDIELAGATFAIPEPSSLALAGLGLLGLVRRRRA